MSHFKKYAGCNHKEVGFKKTGRSDALAQLGWHGISLPDYHDALLRIVKQWCPGASFFAERLAGNRVGIDGHDFRPLLAESFHDPAVHQGTLYKVTNWTPLGLTNGLRRHRADFYQDLESPKQLWVRPMHKNARSLLSLPGQLPEEHQKGIAEATCGLLFNVVGRERHLAG